MNEQIKTENKELRNKEIIAGLMLTAWWRRQTSSTTTPSLAVCQGQEHQLCGQCRDIFNLFINLTTFQIRTRNGGFNGFKCSLSSVMGLDEEEDEGEDEGEGEEEEEQCRCKRFPIFQTDQTYIFVFFSCLFFWQPKFHQVYHPSNERPRGAPQLSFQD